MNDGAATPEALSALTLWVREMPRAVDFYAALGFVLRYGGREAPFTSFHLGDGYLNLQRAEAEFATSWGRAIIYVTDVDAMHARVIAAGGAPEFAPRDGPWGERYFHVRDPDGHELSFAKRLERE